MRKPPDGGNLQIKRVPGGGKRDLCSVGGGGRHGRIVDTRRVCVTRIRGSKLQSPLIHPFGKSVGTPADKTGKDIARIVIIAADRSVEQVTNGQDIVYFQVQATVTGTGTQHLFFDRNGFVKPFRQRLAGNQTGHDLDGGRGIDRLLCVSGKNRLVFFYAIDKRCLRGKPGLIRLCMDGKREKGSDYQKKTGTQEEADGHRPVSSRHDGHLLCFFYHVPVGFF